MRAGLRIAAVCATAVLAVAAGLLLAGGGPAPAGEAGIAPARPPDAPQPKAAALPDGKYTAASRGHVGDVEVEVTIKDGKIAAVKVLKNEEDEPQTALDDVPARIIEKQSTKVDAVTGATQTSQAIMRAAAAALASAAPPAAPKLPDGEYAGVSRGHVDDVAVKVTVKDGKIAAVSVVKHKENRPRTAIKDIPASIVEKQSVKVDAVTGATHTSAAISRAASAALASATPLEVAKLPDGDYDGVSRGHSDDVGVKVTVKDGKIAAVSVARQKESRPLTALKDVPARIVEKQTASVDAVTGATHTSAAITRAAAAALVSARDKAAASQEKKPAEKKAE